MNTHHVYHHGSRCEIVASNLSADEAREKCAELNATETDDSGRYNGSGHYYTTDADDEAPADDE